MKRKITQLALLLWMLSPVIAGAQWQQTTLNNKSITSMTASSTAVFAGSYNYGVYRSMDDGATWTQVNTGLNNLDVWGMAVSGDTVYAGTGNGAYRSTNNGDSWTDISNGLAGIYAIYDFVFMGSSTLVGTLSNVYKSTDNCSSWNYSGTGNFSSTFLVGNGSALFAGFHSNGGVSYSADAGATWTSVGLNPHPIYALGMNGTDLYAGTPDSIYYSPDNGTNWSARINGISNLNRWSLCFAFDGNKAIVGTRGGGVYVSDDNGLNWSFRGTGLPPGSYVNKLLVKGNTIFAGTDYSQGVWKRALTEVTTSVATVDKATQLNIYPNPASDKLVISSSNLRGNQNYIITDITGRKVMLVPVQDGYGSSVYVDVSSLAVGTYVLSAGGFSDTSKMFVIQR